MNRANSKAQNDHIRNSAVDRMRGSDDAWDEKRVIAWMPMPDIYTEG